MPILCASTSGRVSLPEVIVDYIGTNYCPEDKEIEQIKDILIESTLRLKRLDDEIAEMQKALNKLSAERDKLGAYVEGHQALISPARRLPLDIIQEIFTACIPPTGTAL
ncbi:hypothetical protein C8R44DRAFT_870439 [Mycena epipterygia]|nr:hypothetical protein C8R44DRAFT_870439 [Mycena epipterygia]